MTWQITWSLILGFTLSAVIQAEWAAVIRDIVIGLLISGSAPMLKMMGGIPAQQSLQTQISDHQDRTAVPSTGTAQAPTVRSRD